ncbi:PREDICTED: short-chain type dehydrogenase/reductase-like [Wasmannia auropunctata]|uniref:short-chain type dehydrogenase/reductase-like n=1 Tax=Wasmannia auropunctata TaxID=64793 RepID=UPI0005EE316D|nr:PREDICTED: short-chain type dehydrogenase/reductase-like [Wasmannia auropunctata]
MSVKALSGRVFMIVTGASRGIGRQIAITFGSMLEEGSRVLLLARNKDALQEVAKSIPSKVKVCTISADLGKSTDTMFKGINCSHFQNCVFSHIYSQ